MINIKNVIKKNPVAASLVKRVKNHFDPYRNTDFSLRKYQPIPPLEKDLVNAVNFPPQYWTGKENLKYECPWITSGTTLYIANYLKLSDEVLELGSGGSTLFFCRRCEHVTTVESNDRWYDYVKNHLDENSIKNVDLSLCTTEQEHVTFITEQADDAYDWVLVDSTGSMGRSRFARLSDKCLKPSGVLVLNNYRAFIDGLYNELEEKGWTSFFFDDPHWSGIGTSVHIKCKG